MNGTSLCSFFDYLFNYLEQRIFFLKCPKYFEYTNVVLTGSLWRRSFESSPFQQYVYISRHFVNITA